MDSHVVEVRAGAYATPWVLKIGQMGPLHADDHPRVIKRLKDVLGDPDGDPLGGFPHRRSGMRRRVNRGRIGLRS